MCEDHTSPFKFIADIYFERTTASIAMANRGGSKTMSSAIIHLLNSLFKPGCESFSVGAILVQANRAYENLVKLLKAHGKVAVVKDHPMVTDHRVQQTDFVNGSKVEIQPGTVAAVNGPHPQKVHADEIELMDPVVYQESRNMSQSKVVMEEDAATGERRERLIKAQDWLTSTRKRAHGPMQKLLDEIDNAKRNGFRPSWDLYVWCVFETAQNQPNCRMAYPDLPEDQKCQCHMVVKGEWEDGSPRRFSDVCAGRLARSQGYLTIEDIWKTFQESDIETWEAQQECSKPEVGGSVFKKFTRQRHVIKWYEPDPRLGDIYMSVDFGGTNPHGVTWYQLLKYDTMVHGYEQQRSEKPAKRLRAGTLVAFDEIYRAEIGNGELADLVIAREGWWESRWPGFVVKKRFADVAAKAARLDWARHKTKRLPTVFYCTRDIKEQIKTVNNRIDNGTFVVSAIGPVKDRGCPMMVLEIEAYHYPEKKPEMEYDPEVPVDDFNHTVANLRYCAENIKYMQRFGSAGGRPTPKTGGQTHQTAKNPMKSAAPRTLPSPVG